MPDCGNSPYHPAQHYRRQAKCPLLPLRTEYEPDNQVLRVPPHPRREPARKPGHSDRLLPLSSPEPARYDAGGRLFATIYVRPPAPLLYRQQEVRPPRRGHQRLQLTYRLRTSSPTTFHSETAARSHSASKHGHSAFPLHAPASSNEAVRPASPIY